MHIYAAKDCKIVIHRANNCPHPVDCSVDSFWLEWVLEIGYKIETPKVFFYENLEGF